MNNVYILVENENEDFSNKLEFFNFKELLFHYLLKYYYIIINFINIIIL